MNYHNDVAAEDYVRYLYDHVSNSRGNYDTSWIEEAKQKLDEEKDQLSTTSVLYSILQNGQVLRELPTELLDNILSIDPLAILMPYDDDNFLSQLIKNKFLDQAKKAELVGSVTDFMARQRETLVSLGKKVTTVLLTDDPDNPLGPEEHGIKCIQAAFNFNFAQAQVQRQGPLPIPINLLKQLVNLAASSMLKGRKEDNNLTPLQQTVDYQLSFYDHKGQLELTKMLLDKCEEAIWDRVAKNTKLTLPRNGEKLPKEASLYGWHEFTRAQWQRHVGAGIKERSINNEAPSQISVKAQAGVSDSVRSWSKNGMGRAKRNALDTRKLGPENKEAGSDIHNAKEPKELASSIKNNLSGKEAKVYMTKEGQRPHPNGTSNGFEKEHRQRPSLAYKHINSSNPIAATATLDKVNEVNIASEELLKELGLRFLRSTLNPELQFRRKQFVSGGETDFDCVVTDEDVLDAFFGNKKRKYYFTLDIRKKEGYGTMAKQTVDSFLQRYKYNAVLRHVTLCRVNIDLQRLERGRQVYTDQLYFLRWLRGRGVEKILKVTIDDMANPHRDDEIEEVLAGKGAKPPAKSFSVEVLDWRKLDLCPEMIETAAPHVRELHLQWSGNNVVLRGWSEPEGLPKLKWLKKVYLYYEVTPATKKRISKNINSFKTRIANSRVQVKETTKEALDMNHLYESVSTIEVCLIERIVQDGSASSEAANLATEDVEQPWFKNVRDFVDLVPDLPLPTVISTMETSPYLTKVKVALIDDGVDVLETLHMDESKFVPGRSFDTSLDGPSPEFTSVSGHGNFMAKSILRICPNALIVPYRLKTLPGAVSLTPQPEPGSAAKAIKQAINDGVDIISMSWTIQLETTSTDTRGLGELRKVASKARDAKKRIPLIFCAMRDDGAAGARKEDLPAGMTGCKTFRIGAADATGRAYGHLSYSDTDKETMYLFPGVDIQDVLYSEAEKLDLDNVNLKLSHKAQKDLTVGGFTGSSIATALAAGLAALLLHCTKLGVHFTEQMRKEGMHHVDAIEALAVTKNGEFKQMTSAFDKLCARNQEHLKYTNPGDRFQKAFQQLRVFNDDGGVHTDRAETLQPIATLCRSLFD